MNKLVLSLAAASVGAIQLRESSDAALNPIRKVVTMLESIKKKVEAEGEKEEDMYKKYMCYCKTSGGDLQTSVAAAETKVPEVSSAIEEAEASKAQVDADLVKHKEDREAAKKSVAEANALREKEAAAYAAEKAEAGANGQALQKAIAAIEKGMGGAFLQSSAASTLRKLAQSSISMRDDNREELMAFLSTSEGYSPQSGEITGILKEIADEMAAGFVEATATEDAAIKNFEELTAAKAKEIESLTGAIEEKSLRTGELAVNIAEMKNDLDDTTASLLEDKKFLADMKANCDTKSAEWDTVVKTRAEEIVALAETIKILNDDDALELFKKTLPSPSASFVQVKVNKKSLRQRALTMIQAAQNGKPARQQLDFIALALRGSSTGFEKVIAMIDEMVATLKTEQADDLKKKDYCDSEFDKTDDNKKILEQSVADSEAAIADAEEAIATLSSEIEALEDGIKALDKSVAEATEQRKEENTDFKELMAQDSAAKELIAFAKNRLNKFYNPKLHNPSPKRELSAEDKVVVAMGGTAAPTPAPGGIAGTGVEVLSQLSASAQSKDAPPPPPEAVGAYKAKGEESNGVIAMMDMLVKDLDKEMTTAEADEKNAQAEYEQTMADSSDKRASDSKDLVEKQSAKADTEVALTTHKDDKTSTSNELMALLKTIKSLHSECDWLIQYFDARKEARASEVDSLGKAKAVLSGADYSLLQTVVRRVFG